MARIRYQVAMSLDGYIAGPNDEYDWIPEDPDMDFSALFSQFDTVLLGRRTYEPLAQAGHVAMFHGMKTYVASSTMTQSDHPEVTIISGNLEAAVASLRDESEKDVWLFGGGQLFQTLLTARLVDTVEIAIAPVLLGSGIPMAPPPFEMRKLTLVNQKTYDKSGIVLLEYALA